MSGTEVGGGGVTVGIDIGTTSVKAVAADAEGTVLARARVPHGVHTRQPGGFEHDVDEAWRANVLDALGQVAGGHDVAAVNVTAMVPSLGAVHPDGTAAGPGLLYGDRRGEREGHDPTQPGDSGELLAFLAWHAANSADAAGFWPAQAVANHALTGRGAIDSTTAMTAHPLFDFVGWDEGLAAAAGTTPAALPDIVSGVEPAGRVQGGLAGAGALVGGGSIDALAEQLVAGADELGDVLVLCGTTLITWGVVEEWQEVPGLWTIPHTAAGKTMVGGPSNAGGLFLERVRRWLGGLDAATLPAVDPSDLPVWLPYVRGERTPLHRRDLRAELHGAGLHHEAAHLLLAAYEAAGFVVRHHIDLGRAAGLDPRRIVATGGGTQVAAWVQALADCTGLPVDVAAVPEGAALGSAFIARCVAGLEERMTDASRWARTARTVEPRSDWVDAAASRYERFRAVQCRAVTGPLCFEDVAEGDTAPEVRHTLTRTDLVRYAGASGDLNPMHHDDDQARASGLPSVFGHGMFSMGLLARCVTDWTGVGSLRKYKVRFTKQTWPGEELVSTVTVTAKREVDGERLVDLEVSLANAEGQVKAAGEAVVALP